MKIMLASIKLYVCSFVIFDHLTFRSLCRDEVVNAKSVWGWPFLIFFLNFLSILTPNMGL